MAVVKFPSTNLSMSTHGKIGRPWGCGNILAGINYVGDSNPYSGIYQRRPRRKGQILVKMKHYIMPNPQTEKQQAWRQYFADVLQLWHNLDQDFKMSLRNKRLIGAGGWWNKYAKAYMSRKPSDAGVMRAGMCGCGGLTL